MPAAPARPASGVTIGAHQSRHFELTGTVPPDADGYVYVACDFGFADESLGDGSRTEDVARVPGPFADALATFYHDRNDNYVADDGEAVADTRVELLDAITGQVVVRSRTDAVGHVQFPVLPAGLYQIRLAGWTFLDQSTITIGTCPNCGSEVTFRVVPA